MDPEQAILCNQAQLSTVGLGHQLSQKIYSSQLVLPATCVEAMVFLFLISLFFTSMHACVHESCLSINIFINDLECMLNIYDQVVE